MAMDMDHDLQPHGAFLGHVVPGSFFIVWASWWFFSAFREHFLSGPKNPYRSKSWFPQPFLHGVAA